MKKVAIRLSLDEQIGSDKIKLIAQHLQRFIIEGDYKISTIIEALKSNKRIELDVGMEEHMPDFIELVEAFDEEKMVYTLYNFTNEAWEACTLEALNLDRTPKWLLRFIGFTMIWYFVATFVQFFAIYYFYSESYAFGSIFSAIGALITTIIPIVGSLVGYWGATEFWQWECCTTLFAFFGYYLPLLGFFLYLGWLLLKGFYADRWYRFWYSEFN